MTAGGVEVLGQLGADIVEARESLKGRVLELGPETSGTESIEARKNEVQIIAPDASEAVKIIIRAKGSTKGRMLYVDEILPGESFKVRFDGPTLDKEIAFYWLIVKQNRETDFSTPLSGACFFAKFVGMW